MGDFMDFSELTMLAFEASDELKQSQHYLAYLAGLAGLKDESIQPLLTAFDLSKHRYDEIMKIGKHHPDFKVATQALMQAKTNLYQTPQYIAYLSAYEAINGYLGDISIRLNRMLDSCLVSGGIKKACQKGHTHG